ncbi:30 kDa heat shock protein [Leucoagaricus sp. SymC.cos]|nr:30 kDa heat shock protein [Leucoagaricus sp. SymC.cos]
MSITRQLLREFRPLFRMLDEPFGRNPSFLASTGSRHHERNHFFADPFGGLNMLARPAVDVTEKGNKYILDADLPGVSRENLQVRLGDGNQSITIEGKVTERSPSGVHDASAEVKSNTPDTATSAEYTDASHSTSSTTNNGNATQISVERPYTRNYSFMRTVWLPRPVDPGNVAAKLQNGVLSITLTKAVGEESEVINVDVA